MKTFKKIVAVASVIMGLVFFFTGGSDIQLGFGCILTALGILNFPETVKTEVY